MHATTPPSLLSNPTHKSAQATIPARPTTAPAARWPASLLLVELGDVEAPVAVPVPLDDELDEEEPDELDEEEEELDVPDGPLVEDATFTIKPSASMDTNQAGNGYHGMEQGRDLQSK